MTDDKPRFDSQSLAIIQSFGPWQEVERCDRCGQLESQHYGMQQFCPFYSTFRARPSPSRGL